MVLNFVRRSFSTLKKCSAELSTRTVWKSHAIITNTLLVNSELILSARFSNEQRPKLGLRRQNLPPYPHIECIRELKVENYLPSSYKKVQYGEYEFLDLNGYVCLYIGGHHHPRQLDAKSGFSVYFGENHPLNLEGKVERRQGLNHSKLYAFQKGLEQVPKNLFSKLCFMVDEMPLITFIDRSLRSMSENSFRSVQTGKLNKDLETSMEINKLLRTRQDLIIKMMWCPNDIGVDGIYHANKNARNAARMATQEFRKERLKMLDD